MEVSAALHTTQPSPHTWRGVGGYVPSLGSVDFDRQLDKISIWLEKWSHEQRCSLLEALINRSGYSQIQFLRTVTQPSLHRDFMYAAKREYPALDFPPISTHSSREVKNRLIRNRQDTFHRIQSAYYRGVDDIRQATEGKESLPEISLSADQQKTKAPRAKNPLLPSLPSASGSFHSLRSRGSKRTQAVLFDGEGGKSQWHLLYTSPPYLRFIEMPVRRHIQDEENMDLWDSGTSTLPSSRSMHKSLTSPELSLSLRERKRKRTHLKKHLKKMNCDPQMEKNRLFFEGQQVLMWYIENWDDLQRNEFIHKLLLKLDPRQHYFISSLLSVKEAKDFIEMLPKNIALQILSHLSAKELCVCSRVNKYWYKLSNTNDLWKFKCEEIKLEIPVKSKKPDWKRIYRDNKYIKQNWSLGRCQVIDCKGHTDKVLCVTCDPKRIATGSGNGDRSIKIWEYKSGHLVQTLRGHSKGVWCLRFFTKNLLVSGSYDCTIRVWNLREGSCVRTLVGHEGPVWALVNRGSTLVSASQDKTAKVWDISRCLLVHTLTGHSAAVFAVDMDEEGCLVITGSADRSVRIWSAETGKIQKILWVSQTTSVMSVSYNKGYIACSYGETICLYRVEGSRIIRRYEGHEKRIESVQLKINNPSKPEGVMVSAGKDGVLKYWDIQREKCIHSFTGHTGRINCVYLDEIRIITASYDNKLKIWDFNI